MTEAIRTKWKFIVEFEDEETQKIAGTIGRAGTREECEMLIEGEVQERRSLGCVVINAEAAEFCAQCEGEGSIPVEDNVVAICDFCGGWIGSVSRIGPRYWKTSSASGVSKKSPLRAAS